MSDYDSDEEPTASDETVLNKYKVAGDVVHVVLKELMKKCTAGAKIIELCELGDKRLLEETAKLFKKEKELKKGLAFPTTISVNNIICHYSPIDGEDNAITELKDEDLVKIDLGAHIDGFAAVVGHTFVVGASSERKVSGKKADVILAAYNAAEATIRLLRPGNENFKVTNILDKVTSEFKCMPVEGVQSHLLRKNIFDGDKAIVQHPTEDHRRSIEKCTFEMFEAWVVDIVVSTGDGKARDSESRTTVYKKNGITYGLKMKTSRQFFAEVSSKFQEYPFNIRDVGDLVKSRMGANECARHNVVTPMPVMEEKEDEMVAQFKFTVVLMPNGPMRITGLPFDTSLYTSKCKVKDPEVKELLAQPIKTKKKPANA